MEHKKVNAASYKLFGKPFWELTPTQMEKLTTQITKIAVDGGKSSQRKAERSWYAKKTSHGPKFLNKTHKDQIHNKKHKFSK